MNLLRNVIFVSALLSTGVVMATEEPKYTVETEYESFEIRQYASTLVAETYVVAEFADAGNQAFRILADYIFGNNVSQKKIDMTAPVSQVKSETIAMTAPVSQSQAGIGYWVQFTMPAEFNLSNIPKPNDPRVKIKEVPSRRVAVFRYSGSWSEERYVEKLNEFKKQLQDKKIKTRGEPVFARYNSPFKLWFLRRNEIMFDL